MTLERLKGNVKKRAFEVFPISPSEIEDRSCYWKAYLFDFIRGLLLIGYQDRADLPHTSFI
jgi:hypothetical protein